MPRGRVKAISNNMSNENNMNKQETHLFTTVKKDIEVKMKPKDDDYPTSSGVVPDLSKFKFQKKPHVKIEFEKDLPPKKEPGLWEPPNWREFLLNLRNMRANNDAPVDTMGCHKAKDENAPPEVMRYQTLIALMLSSQTKDQVTFAAMDRLKTRGLTVDGVLEMSDEELGQLIYPVGFWKTKVKYIKKTTQTLKEQYNGDIPDSVEKLCKLTGVGLKMAHICMQAAWNKITGIGVDTHVHRISNRIGWVKKPTPTPEDTRKALESWLPFELWSEVNHLMVGFGQTICTPISPICNECLNRDICPSSGKGRKSPNKKTPIKQEIKSEDNEENKLVEVKRIPVLKLEPVIPSNKRKKSPKKESLDLPQEDKVSFDKNTNKKSPKIKKTEALDNHDADMDDFKQPVKPLKSPQSKLSESQNKTSLLKRKSPRNKGIKSEQANVMTSNDAIIGKKTTRATKK